MFSNSMINKTFPSGLAAIGVKNGQHIRTAMNLENDQAAVLLF